MGIKEDNEYDLFWKIMMQADSRMQSVTLSDEDRQRVNQLTFRISDAIAHAINRQPIVSQNVLEYTMAKVVALVLKLNCDIFGYTGGEAEHMAVLIRQAWDEIKDQEIDYGTCTGT